MTDEQRLIKEQAEEIERLKEQLRLANELIKQQQEEKRRIELIRMWYG